MFLPPEHCPACDSTLEWRKDQLYCLNSECPAKSQKLVEHFVKTLKIKGLGPATINQLKLQSIFDIYENDLSAVSSDKIREKLKEEIERSKSSSLNLVLPALGIPLIGNSATSKLSEVCSSIFDINEENCQTAGLGPKATSNLVNWLTVNLDEYLQLPFDFLFEETKEPKEAKGVVCISGKLTSYKTKSAAKEQLEKAGWKVVDSVTKEVTHLVNESGKSSAKTQKAMSSGIIIVNSVTNLL